MEISSPRLRGTKIRRFPHGRGWDTNSPADTIKIWKSGFLGFAAADGGQLAEMDGNTLEQTFATTPGNTLTWSFLHRGRDGTDSVALDLGPFGAPLRVGTFSSANQEWVKYQGTYIVEIYRVDASYQLTLLPHPDLANIRIRRLQEGGSEKVIEVNLAKIIAAPSGQLGCKPAGIEGLPTPTPKD